MFLCMVFAVGVPRPVDGGGQRGPWGDPQSPVTKVEVYICAAVLTLAGMFGWSDHISGAVAMHVCASTSRSLGLFLRIASAAACSQHVRAFALLCAASFSRFYSALGVSVAFLTLNYFVALVSEWWPQVQFLRRVTLFYLVYYSDIWHSWPLRNMAILAAILLFLAVMGGIIWHRRDLPL
jgi:hypothetical protein